MSNSLDPDQAQCFVGPDMGSKLFAKVTSRGIVGRVSKCSNFFNNFLTMFQAKFMANSIGPVKQNVCA